MKYRVLIGLAAWLVTGCTGVVVRKAQLQSVHSVAVISWFAAQRVPEVRGQGVMRKLDNEIRLQIAEDALTANMDAFESLGWEVAPADEVANREAYKRAFEHRANIAPPGLNANAFRRHVFMATDMFPIWVESEDIPTARPTRKITKTLKEDTADFLRDLRLDAALFIKAQYCFRTFERDNKERVLVTAASAVQIVDKHAKLLFSTPMEEGCGGQNRGESTGSMEIVGEDWIFDPMKREEIRALFREASQAEAFRLIASLPVTPRPARAH
jgi:hypothetical protein